MAIGIHQKKIRAKVDHALKKVESFFLYNSLKLSFFLRIRKNIRVIKVFMKWMNQSI